MERKSPTKWLPLLTMVAVGILFVISDLTYAQITDTTWTSTNFKKVVYFRTTAVKTPKSEKNATFTITAVDNYVLYINGDSVGTNTDGDWKTAETWTVKPPKKQPIEIAVKVINSGIYHEGSGFIIDGYIEATKENILTGISPAWRYTHENIKDWTTADYSGELWQDAYVVDISDSVLKSIENLEDTQALPVGDGTETCSPLPADSGKVVLSSVSSGVNLALGKYVTDMKGDEVESVTDGELFGPACYWSSVVPEAMGFYLKIDLGVPQILHRIRILPQSLDKNTFVPDTASYIKGYSIRISLDDVSYEEVLLNLFNEDPVVDTTFTPTPGRYVKVVVAAIDNINKVIIGDIEVYGTGYVQQGVYTSAPIDFGTSEEKNFGKVVWKADIPSGSKLTMQFRSGAPLDASGQWEWSKWSEPSVAASGKIFYALEPRRYFQYRANLFTSDPMITPKLKQVTAYYSTVPLARRAYGSVTAVKDTLPNEVEVGSEVSYIYTVQAQLDEKSLGFNKLVILTPTASYVDSVDTNGVVLTEGVDYVDSTTSEAIVIRFTHPIMHSIDAINVHFRASLFLDANDFPGYLALQTQSVSTNFQYLEENVTAGRSWTIYTYGYVGEVLEADKVRVEPNPLSPNGDGICDYTVIKFTIAKLDEPRRVSIKIFDLNGTVVWKKDMLKRADVYQEKWDGKDLDGELVPPGLYIYQIDVDADENCKPVTGTVVVVY